MDEAAWREAIGPEPLVAFLASSLSERKLRLFACACCRQVWHLLPDEKSRRAVAVAERYADGLVEQRERTAARASALQATRAGGSVTGQAAWAPYWAASSSIRPVIWNASVAAAEALVRHAVRHRVDAAAYNAARAAAALEQAGLFRDLTGNPFRPVRIDSAWLTWNDRLVVRLAQAVYEESAFDRLPILGDALEDAGCTDADILTHCRAADSHARGCWVVDALLGQENG
jgi:hypothetical protein